MECPCQYEAERAWAEIGETVARPGRPLEAQRKRYGEEGEGRGKCARSDIGVHQQERRSGDGKCEPRGHERNGAQTRKGGTNALCGDSPPGVEHEPCSGEVYKKEQPSEWQVQGAHELRHQRSEDGIMPGGESKRQIVREKRAIETGENSGRV